MGTEDEEGELEGALAGGVEFAGGASAFEEGGEVEPVTIESGERDEDEAAEGEALPNEEEAVAFDEVGLESGGAAGGMGVTMEDAGGGGIAAGPAGPMGTESEVGVFAVEKERFVETAKFGEEFEAVEGPGATGEEAIVVFERGGEALLAGAVDGDEEAGGFVFDVAGGHAGAGMGIKGGDEGGEPFGVGDGVVVEGGDEFGGEFAGAEIDGGAEADVGGWVQNCCFDWGTKARELAAAVIDNDGLEFPERLMLEGLDTVPEGSVGRESRDDYCYPRGSQAVSVAYMDPSLWSVQYAIAADRRDPLARFRDRFVFDEEPAVYLRGHLLGRLPKAAVGVMQGAVEESWGRRLERDWGAVTQRVAEKLSLIVGTEVELGEGLVGRDVTGEAGVMVLRDPLIRGSLEGFLCGGPGAPRYFSEMGDPGVNSGLAVAAAEPGLDLTLEAGVGALAAKARTLGEYVVELVGDGAELGVGRVTIRQEGAERVARVLEEEHRVMVDWEWPDRLVLGLAPLYTSFVEAREAVVRWRAVARDRR